MKRFKIILILFMSLIFNNLNYALNTTMYACCSPFGVCDLRLFDSRTVCMASCSGHNRCEAHSVQTAPAVMPFAYRAPYVSPLTAAISTRATPYGIAPNAPIGPIAPPIAAPLSSAGSRVVESGSVSTTAIP